MAGNGDVRFPAVLLLVYAPHVLRETGPGYTLTTGLAEPPDYAARWLLVTVGLLVASAALYGVRVLRASRGASAPPRERATSDSSASR